MIFDSKTQHKESSSTRVLCLITHGLYEPWLSILKEGQESTWLSEEFPANFEVLHVYGQPVSSGLLAISEAHDNLRWRSEPIPTLLRLFDLIFTLPLYGWKPSAYCSGEMSLRHQAIEVNLLDIPLLFRWKLRAAINYALQIRDFDYLFMTTTSSYIYPKKLMEITRNLPRKRYIGGAVIYPGANFAPGSNRLFSRDVMEAYIGDFWAQSPSNLEDVALSKSLKRLGFQISSLPHLPVTSIQEVEQLTFDVAQSHYHFRVKSGELYKRNDIPIMRALHDKLKTFGMLDS